MRYSLLDLVQRILESMESDEVSTVGETPESLSVANIIKECYFDIVGQHSMAEQEGLYKLDASTDNTKPTLMYIPENVSSVKWVKYSRDHSSTIPLRYTPNEEMMYLQDALDTSDGNVGSMTVSINNKSFVFKYRTDGDPTTYSIFDDRYVIFDAYQADEEDTLQEVNSTIWATLVPTFVLNDDFIPDLDPRQFQLLLNEAKAQAFVELKQTENPKAEKKARRNHIQTQQNKRDNDPAWANQLHASFGRRGKFGYPRDAMQRALRNGR